jgi:hypothetical protein
MNAPAPGWNPDPTGRHEYRDWDGGTWTDDVSDNGVTSVDPVAGPAPIGGEPTTVVDPTEQYAARPGQQTGGYPPQPGAYDPMYGSGQVAPAQPPRSGPPTGLIVGLAALAVALIAGLAFVLTSGGDDDETPTDEASSSSDTPADDTTDDTSADDTTDDTTGDDIAPDDVDDTSTDGIVDLIATGMELEADGLITREQAECAAQAMVDHFGLETLLEMSTTREDPWAGASTEDQAALVSLMTECIPVDVLVDIGLANEGG